MKTIFTFALAAAVSVCPLVTGAALAQESINLRVETSGNYLKPIYEEIARRFSAEHADISVTVGKQIVSTSTRP